MSWNYDKSKVRIKKHAGILEEIQIEKLTREADLNNLLTETCCREIHGAHVYVHVSNFAKMATEKVSDEKEYKRFIQAVHIYQREVARIVEHADKFSGLRVHFQGAKLHALFYRPIDKTEKLAIKAFFLQLVLKDFVDDVFNPAFPFHDDFKVAGGADVGDVRGTRNGSRDDRELLFLGAAANYAAKIINDAGQFRITKDLFDALPEKLQECCDKINDDVYQIQKISQTTLDELLEEYDIPWDREASEKRVKDDKTNYPLKDVEYSSANSLIDIDLLGITNNKRVLAASIYGDVTGFTAYIDSADTDDKKKEALKVLHVIRKEMATVVKKDFEGIRVQFQGDRVQGLYHLPKDNEADIATEAVDAAVGLQSSMEKTIKEVLPEAGHLKLAVGVDLDKTLVTKLGTHAHRDRICLGQGVESAAKLEEKCSGGQIGVSKRIYDVLPERLSKHFSYDNALKCYVAENLTADKVERAAKAAHAVAGAPAFINSSKKSGIEISHKESEDARMVIPARSYAGE
ncbi:MAG: adenylate/guanylate cyclase domain-containing protein [Pyrinomonadaceae bacterium]